MKKLTCPLFAVLLLSVLAVSCQSGGDQQFRAEMQKIAIKQKQLEYLKELYDLKHHIEYKAKIQQLDSLINNEAGQ